MAINQSILISNSENFKYFKLPPVANQSAKISFFSKQFIQFINFDKVQVVSQANCLQKVEKLLCKLFKQ